MAAPTTAGERLSLSVESPPMVEPMRTRAKASSLSRAENPALIPAHGRHRTAIQGGVDGP